MTRKLVAAAMAGLSAVSVAAVSKAPAVGGSVAAMPLALQVSTPGASTAQPAYAVSPALRSSLDRWNALRQSDSLPFSAYASFLLSHRGWPGEAAMRRTAEKAIDPGSTSAYEVTAYFRALPPLGNVGRARHAFALLATGNAEAARDAARSAWRGGVLPLPDEQRLTSLFGSALTPADHEERMEVLLAGRDTQSAQRALAFAPVHRRPLYEARLALQGRSSSAPALLAALGSSGDSDPGLLMDRANWLRGTGQGLAARQLLANRPPLGRTPADAEAWFETLLTIARAAANDGQWSTAYQIASRLGDAYPTGTDVSDRPYGERDHYTSLAWLAGSAALHRLGRPADAARMFELYARAARSPQTRSKGFYWAARAAGTAGDAAGSDAFLEQAAASPDQFYGQLSLERLGRSPAPPQAMASFDPAARAAFNNRNLVEATRALGLMGRWSDQSVFIRALAEQSQSDTERGLAGELGRQLGRPDLGVWVAREARSAGENYYARPGFPEVQVPPAYARLWTLAHAIMRQESSFDRMAVSHAGARGMMQLMPGTARETAGKTGLPYDFSRLTADPAYNVNLGTYYLSQLLDQWGGNVMLAVASYNAGSGNVRRWVRERGDPRLPGTDVIRWVEEIPFSETRNYVQRVLENAVVYDLIAPPSAGGPRRNALSGFLGKSRPG